MMKMIVILMRTVTMRIKKKSIVGTCGIQSQMTLKGKYNYVANNKDDCIQDSVEL